MPGIFFTNAWMLLGLAALSVPLIIHLLLRRKKKRFRFSTLQFFLRQDEQSAQRRKLRHLLLLTLRMLIFLLLVLAFARPFLERSAGGAAGRERRALIVLDRSLSMQAVTADGSAWTRAVDAARQILAQLRPDDRAALISAGPQPEVLCEWAPPAAISQRLKDLQPTFGAANLADALAQAKRLLAIGDHQIPATVYLVSDFQRNGCQNLASSPLPETAELKVIKIGDLLTPNLAVTDLQLDPPNSAPPHATLTSFSDQDAPALQFELSVDGKVVSSRPFALSAGASTNVELNLPKLKSGWHDVAVQLRTHDALAADDSRFDCLLVPEPTHVLVVETRPTKHSFDQESFFVRAALNPGDEESTNGSASRFVCEKLSADELAARLASAKGRTNCDLVLLPGLKQIPSALGQGLMSFLNSGGGVMIFVGDGISANRYHAELGDALPARLETVQARGETEPPWHIAQYDTNLIFNVFASAGTGNLSLPRFTTRFSLQPTAGSTVVARFDDGTPSILLRQIGRGRALLVNSSEDTAWNDWPKHKTFVPWLHAAAVCLTTSPTQSMRAASANFIAGAPTDLDLGHGFAKAILKLRSQAGKQVVAAADDHGLVHDISSFAPGAYVLQDSSGTDIRHFAINLPARESNLGALAATDVQQQIARVPEDRATTLAAGLFGSGSSHRELWRTLLLAVLGLLLLELLVANRTTA
jgi:hypothetical protein